MDYIFGILIPYLMTQFDQAALPVSTIQRANGGTFLQNDLMTPIGIPNNEDIILLVTWRAQPTASQLLKAMQITTAAPVPALCESQVLCTPDDYMTQIQALDEAVRARLLYTVVADYLVRNPSKAFNKPGLNPTKAPSVSGS